MYADDESNKVKDGNKTLLCMSDPWVLLSVIHQLYISFNMQHSSVVRTATTTVETTAGFRKWWQE